MAKFEFIGNWTKVWLPIAIVEVARFESENSEPGPSKLLDSSNPECASCSCTKRLHEKAKNDNAGYVMAGGNLRSSWRSWTSFERGTFSNGYNSCVENAGNELLQSARSGIKRYSQSFQKNSDLTDIFISVPKYCLKQTIKVSLIKVGLSNFSV